MAKTKQRGIAGLLSRLHHKPTPKDLFIIFVYTLLIAGLVTGVYIANSKGSMDIRNRAYEAECIDEGDCGPGYQCVGYRCKPKSGGGGVGGGGGGGSCGGGAQCPCNFDSDCKTGYSCEKKVCRKDQGSGGGNKKPTSTPKPTKVPNPTSGISCKPKGANCNENVANDCCTGLTCETSWSMGVPIETKCVKAGLDCREKNQTCNFLSKKCCAGLTCSSTFNGRCK